MKFNKPFNPTVFVAGLLVMTGFTGCWKKSGEAMVVEKEFLAAGEEPVTPTPGPASNPAEPSAAPVKPVATPPESGDSEEDAAKPLAEDEIVVESYVMKKNVRGTSKDPRAYPGLEQWRITIRMVEGGRGFTVQAKQAQYERLKEIFRHGVER